MPRSRDEILNDISACESKLLELREMPEFVCGSAFSMRGFGFMERFFFKERYGCPYDRESLELELEMLREELRYFGRIC